MSSVLDRIKLQGFPESQYIKEETSKKCIFLHHTASSANPFGVMEYWESNDERVATHFIIGGKAPTGVTAWTDGQIIQMYSSKYWAWHLGTNPASHKANWPIATSLVKESIGIEICNWGTLTKRADGKFLSYAGTIVPLDQVITFDQPYRGSKYHHAYTDAQIASTKDLLQYLGPKFGIPLKFKGMEMFDLCTRARDGESGVWTHTSVRIDKSDCSPQPKLIAMLKSL